MEFERLPPPPAIEPGDALFLDVDGTIAEIRDRPELVRIEPAVAAALRALVQRLDGCVALVSGRALAWLEAEAVGLGVALVGTHGLEWRLPGGEREAAEPLPGLRPAIAAAERFAAAHPHVLAERKALGVAIHYRLAPEREHEVLEFAASLAAEHALPSQHGKMVVELKGNHSDKGAAVTALLKGRLFAGRRPVYAGDDLTDEAAFAAADRLGGHGILVGPPRPSAAKYGLAGVAAVADWLAWESGE